MRSNRLNSILGKLARLETTDPKRNQTLEADLLSMYRRLHPQNRRWLMLLNPWNRIARFASVGLVLCLVVVGACTTETITEVEVGKRLQLGLDGNSENPTAEGQFLFVFKYLSPEDMTQEAKKMSDLLTVQPGVADASVSISQQSSGEVNLDMLVWGDGLDTDGLVNVLQTSYPVLGDASVSVSDLNTTIKESYAAKLGREFLHVEVSGSDPEELRQQVLEQLAAQGFTGDAKVDVETEGDSQTIHIEVEESGEED
jgi:hypothetical protein